MKRIVGRLAALADGRRVVGVVLARRALGSIRRHQLRAHQPRQQPQLGKPSRPVVRTRAHLHGYDATGGQPRAPRQELLARQRAAAHHRARGIDRVHLNHALGQIGTDSHDARFTARAGSCNLLHGLPLSIASD